ncbi:Thioester reductase domain-containing protein [Halogranum gelatinilyticum]|uniref:Thioester reductase domain-containing protein n=1 Tax=Halogranum gelatinilyticum TaxID=660521 RepID=A0A1G9XDB0_9EURY|nr:SDR family oxidoreductase [Halogranum gelatinilyticum]SDM94714.1 Thioester reductase domain-containing protein [Halogranum gelatinilyticum]
MSPRVLLTGFPGFLGSQVVERLLARDAGPVACLVQPKFRALAEERAADVVGDDAYDADGPIRLYEGDITEPGLGLGDALAELDSVSEVYHLAAVYDLAVSREVGEAVNVRGTEHVLDVAEDLAVDRFHYVSTCYVSGRYDGVFTEDHLREGQSFNNHYEETKYRAEVLVHERMAEGLPATVYRPSIVVGDSETGETGKYDGPYYLLRLLLAQPALLSVAPTIPGAATTELNVVPRDFVVDAIDYLSQHEAAVGEVVQLCDPAPLRIPAFVDSVADALGHRVVSVPTTKGLAKRGMRLLQARGVAAEPATLDYFDHPTRYACPNARRLLAGSGIEPPAFNSYVDRLVAYVRAHPEIRSDAMV